MTVQQVASLAKLTLSPEEEGPMEEAFAQMLDFVSQMQAEEQPRALPQPHAAALRPDVPRPGLDREDVLMLAPERKDAYISVPKSFD